MPKMTDDEKHLLAQVIHNLRREDSEAGKSLANRLARWWSQNEKANKPRRKRKWKKWKGHKVPASVPYDVLAAGSIIDKVTGEPDE